MKKKQQYPKIHFFHRNLKAGFSINKVTQTVVRNISNKIEFYSLVGLKSFRRNIINTFKNRNKYGINHITGDIHYCMLGLIGCKSVLTIHDTVSLDFHPKLKGSHRVFFEYLWYRIPLFLATKIVCISEATKNSLKKYTKRDDIIVIHNAIDDSFENFPQNMEPHRFRVLLIGTNPNKNVHRTIEALIGIDCVVSIIGPLKEEIISFLKQNQIAYENKIGLSDIELIEEYKNCDMVSFVSLFEGFGMPVIEANKIGRPVLCSDIPVLHEVAGDSAVFVNPYDVGMIHEGILKLKNNQDLVKQCIASGFENVKRFDRKLIFDKWVSLYSSMLNIDKSDFYLHYCE